MLMGEATNMNDEYEAWRAFQAGERDVDCRLVCTECGGRAEGNASWSDGSGELCDACVAKDMASEVTATDIAALQDEAARAGDSAQVRLCQIVLTQHDSDRWVSD